MTMGGGKDEAIQIHPLHIDNLCCCQCAFSQFQVSYAQMKTFSVLGSRIQHSSPLPPSCTAFSLDLFAQAPSFTHQHPSLWPYNGVFLLL